MNTRVDWATYETEFEEIPNEPEDSRVTNAKEQYYNRYGEEASDFYMMSASTSGDITFGFFLDNFEITYYSYSTTEFAAIGWIRLSYHAAEDEWVFSDFSSSASTG